MFITANHLHDLNDVKIMFGKEFDMKDLVVSKYIIGMEIYKDMSFRKLWFSQKSYVERY